MNNNTVVATPETLPVIIWNNQPVITTELLTQIYGTEIKNIQKNITRNASRFIEGVHYFLLKGADLKAFKADRLKDGQLVVHKFTTSLYLWTERGAVRHAKILDTEQAWAVQGKLEDCYFHKVAEKRKQPQQAQLDLFNADHITISKDDYIDLLKSKNQLLEVALSNQAKPTAKSKPEKRKWFWTQADIDALNGYVNQGLANWKIAELTGRSLSAVSCAIARYVVKGGAA